MVFQDDTPENYQTFQKFEWRETEIENDVITEQHRREGLFTQQDIVTE